MTVLTKTTKLSDSNFKKLESLFNSPINPSQEAINRVRRIKNNPIQRG